ncbi:glycogen synthase GlgA [Sulfuritalea sp.]|uniref:glycogen synthase GlgA n=1 Tax=Sulfuritalea sp. TaxID=2480090 RepID=UPI001AC26EAE|nr:glycogen synthase GlgA [Sulfuritalea sp.]MBN8476478.1 glycogen synthase GlgA [Sulfuritalea sp.]
MKVLFATSELAPWVKTGGLGDVAGSLPAALRAQDVDVRVLVPAYPALAQAFPDAVEVARPHWLGGLLPTPGLKQAVTPDGTPLLLLDYPHYFDRTGNPYLGPEGRDWLDNHLRFGLLSRVAAWIGSDASTLDWQPDVIHCNDWQTGLAPAYLRYLPGRLAKSLLTVHNLAFQGLFDHASLFELGLPDASWHLDGVEYHGYLSFLKAGLQQADAISTVSPSYAREIQTDAEGMGMAGLLRHRAARLSGILNGIDTQAWNPATDPHLPNHYGPRRLEAKAANKAGLQVEVGLDLRDDLPLLAVVSRLTEQKGLDLLLQIAPRVLELPAQLVILGSGDHAMERAFASMAHRHPGQCAVRIGFDEGFAHRIEAGADIFLMPSRFEPCGLNQMYSLRYGTPPVVRATGGLADTVVDAADEKHGNGFVFGPATAAALLDAVQRAATAWRDPALWRRLQKRGMARDSSWASAARHYVDLYRAL